MDDDGRVRLAIHRTPDDGSCGPEAVLGGLNYLFRSYPDFNQSIPVDAQHLRDRVIDHIISHADERINDVSGESFRQSIRLEYVNTAREVRDSDYYRAAIEADENPFQTVRSFIGWTRAMRRPGAFVDEFFMAASAMLFQIQICVVRLAAVIYTPEYYECPEARYRIILLSNNDHFEW